MSRRSARASGVRRTLRRDGIADRQALAGAFVGLLDQTLHQVWGVVDQLAARLLIERHPQFGAKPVLPACPFTQQVERLGDDLIGIVVLTGGEDLFDQGLVKGS